jgi:hypothetical protein
MFGQTFHNLPWLLREPSTIFRTNLYLRLHELCLCARVCTKCGTFHKCLCKPSGTSAQTLGLALCKPSASCCANLRLRLPRRPLSKITPTLPNDLVKNTSMQAPGAPEFIEYEHGALDLHSCDGPAFLGFAILHCRHPRNPRSQMHNNWFRLMSTYVGIFKTLGLLSQFKSTHSNIAW